MFRSGGGGTGKEKGKKSMWSRISGINPHSSLVVCMARGAVVLTYKVLLDTQTIYDSIYS